MTMTTLNLWIFQTVLWQATSKYHIQITINVVLFCLIAAGHSMLPLCEIKSFYVLLNLFSAARH